MKSLISYITPLITVTAVGGLISLTEVAEAAHIATRWNFEFTGQIVGHGFIEIDEHQENEITSVYEVIDLQFTLDFDIGSGSQNVTLANFSNFTKPLIFSPDDSSNELLHTSFFARFIPELDPLQPEWILGTVDGVGNFTISGSGEGANIPDDPQGVVGGVIIFTSNESSPQTRTGTWTAQPIPEPLTILGSLTALSFGTFFKSSLKVKK